MLVSALKHQWPLSPYFRLFVEIVVLYTAPFVWRVWHSPLSQGCYQEECEYWEKYRQFQRGKATGAWHFASTPQASWKLLSCYFETWLAWYVVCGLGCPSFNLPACLLSSSITDVCHYMWEILGNRWHKLTWSWWKTAQNTCCSAITGHWDNKM